MKIGVMTGSRPGGSKVTDIGRTHTIEEIVGLAQRVEAAGLDTLWMANVFALDAIMTLAFAGHATSRIEVGTAVTPTYPRHPTAIAQQAVTAAAATGNRFTLGIGLAHKVMIEDALGISFDRPARHMREYLEILAPLLRGEEVSYAGEQYRVSEISVRAAGAGSVPLVVAALGEQMLKLAGRLSDGTTTWMCGPKTIEGHIIPTLSAAAAAAGRPSPRVIAGFPVVLTHDVAGARAKLAPGLGVYGQLPSYRSMLDREGIDEAVDIAIVGDEQVLRDGIARARDAGATDFNAAIAEVDEGAFDRTFEFLASEFGSG
ncbi:MAG: TIGR03564 family F420-dependent LLM class oxidoreductase [Gammaproteobacteria bacterium]